LLGATTVVAWGRNHCGQLGDESTTTKYSPVAVSTLVGVNAIAGGKGEEATTLAWGNHSLAIAGGRVFAWGLNNRGQLGNGTRGNSSTPVRVVGL
jgi:alpha-tubulin suppressor-like RCC1 family protein